MRYEHRPVRMYDIETGGFVNIDPLTCDAWDLPWGAFEWGCTCNHPPEAFHAPTCGVQPIYAELYERYMA